MVKHAGIYFGFCLSSNWLIISLKEKRRKEEKEKSPKREDVFFLRFSLSEILFRDASVASHLF